MINFLMDMIVLAFICTFIYSFASYLHFYTFMFFFPSYFHMSSFTHVKLTAHCYLPPSHFSPSKHTFFFFFLPFSPFFLNPHLYIIVIFTSNTSSSPTPSNHTFFYLTFHSLQPTSSASSFNPLLSPHISRTLIRPIASYLPPIPLRLERDNPYLKPF